MMRRTLTLYAIAAIAAFFCIVAARWQYGRHREVASLNSVVEERLEAPPVTPASLPPDPGLRAYRRVEVNGQFEPSGEWLWANRVMNGSPGVNILTPLRMQDGQAIVVNRGWVYAPDGRAADRARFRETGMVTVRGYAQEFAGADGPADDPEDRVIGRVRRAQFAAADPDVAPFYIVATDVEFATPRTPEAVRDSTPNRLPEPALSGGPHLSYMLQWIAFAIIVVVGTVFLDRQSRRRHRAAAEPAGDTGTGAAAGPGTAEPDAGTDE